MRNVEIFLIHRKAALVFHHTLQFRALNATLNRSCEPKTERSSERLSLHKLRNICSNRHTSSVFPVLLSAMILVGGNQTEPKGRF